MNRYLLITLIAGMLFLAENVETDQQMRQLLSLNCDEMRGFLFSKPLPAVIFEASFLARLAQHD